jgi:lipopolysaccharide/colanic/teichoic acid biosynthesis glycosyltransferase
MVKRFFDLFFSVAGLIPLFPVFALIATFIKLDSPGPVFFRQVRVGQYGELFRIFKFRTMVTDAEKKGPLISRGDDPRITRIGAFLRKYKIDELPQLLNVIIGDMSLVGPRPEVPCYVDAFREQYQLILMVRPGITDYASLEFKDENDLLRAADDPERKYIDEILPVKIEYYKRYLLEQSLLTDIKLIFRTLSGIVRR